MSPSVRRLWPAVVLIVLLGAVWAVPALRQVGAERQRQNAEAMRQAEARRLLTSDPVRFEEYVRQVAIAADVIGDGEQDASGPCRSVSGFESGVGDPPTETRTCVIRDPGKDPATVTLTLSDGRVFRWPRE